jgi:hypothetical protein
MPGATVNRSAGTRLAVTCAAVALAAAPLAAGAPAMAAPVAGAAQVSVAITSVNPDVATPGKPVTVSGTVSNGTADAVSGLAVQLRSSGSALTSRGDLTNYAAGNLPVDSPVTGAVGQLPGTLSPGATEKWAVSIPAHQLGMTAFGVYPLAAEVDDNTGVTLDTDRSFLPFWPAKSPLAGPLQIAWVWPVIDSPHQAACQALLNDSLAASVAPGGRLAGLLAAGVTPAASSADLTWAIDPGLLASVSAMTKPYRVGGTATCAGTTGEPASTAARAWLGGLRSVTAKSDFFVTPYNDVDVAALTHQGMDSDLTHAFNDGRSVARTILGSAQRPATAATDQDLGHASPPDGIGGIAWPADGTADYGVLGNLAVNGVGTVLLDSTMMPPVTQVSYTPSAVTKTPDGVGAELNVALADDTLTQILGSPGTSFSTEQRFLAETAMIAAERPALRRSIVVAPPRQWDPAGSGQRSALRDSHRTVAEPSQPGEPGDGGFARRAGPPPAAGPAVAPAQRTGEVPARPGTAGQPGAPGTGQHPQPAQQRLPHDRGLRRGVVGVAWRSRRRGGEPATPAGFGVSRLPRAARADHRRVPGHSRRPERLGAGIYQQ